LIIPIEKIGRLNSDKNYQKSKIIMITTEKTKYVTKHFNS